MFSYSDLPNSSLISSVTGPGHTVTNTWAADRDALLAKENKVTPRSAFLVFFDPFQE